MAHQASISIPASTADKLAALGRAMLDLAQEMKQQAAEKDIIGADLTRIPADQQWFWTAEWQAMEKEADEAIAQGKYVAFDNAKDAVAYLHRQA